MVLKLGAAMLEKGKKSCQLGGLPRRQARLDKTWLEPLISNAAL
jgi:hypothetical protein